MFTIKRTYLGVPLAVATFPIDSLGQAYTFESITVQSLESSDKLDIAGVQANITFNGESFPLDGANYLSAVTGNLVVTVTESLAQGLYRFPFVTQDVVYPITGFALHGGLGFGIQSYARRHMETALLVQSFTIPGIDLPNAGVGSTIPTLTG